MDTYAPMTGTALFEARNPVTSPVTPRLDAPPALLQRRAARRLQPSAVAVAIALVLSTAVIALAYDLALRSTGPAHFAVFWVGYVLALVAVVLAGLRETAGRGTRSLLLLGLGVVTFVPKFLMSRSSPVYFDEFSHVRHARDLATSGHLRVPTPYLPIERDYPGLPVATNLVRDVLGLPLWQSGQLLVLLSHCLVLLLVARLARAIGISPRAAFLAAIVYSLNSSYLYFDTQYSYESVALTLSFSVVALLVLARQADTTRYAVSCCAGAALVAAAVIPTHHISAAFMVLSCAPVCLLVPVRGATRGCRRAARLGPWVVTAAAATGVVLWVRLVAPETVGYIRPHLAAGIDQASERLFGGASARSAASTHKLFQGSGLPAYEMLCSYAGQVLVGLSTLGALARAWRERRDREALRRIIPFALTAGLYFVSLPLALTAAGGESAHRLWGFAYLGIALLAVWGAPSWRLAARRLAPTRHPGRWPVTALGCLALVIVAIGNVAAGENVLYRFPGPYVFGTETRSQTPELHELAAWVTAELPAGSSVVTDRLTGEIITSATSVFVPSPMQSAVYGLYRQGNHAGPRLRAFLAGGHFRYWIIDDRIASLVPQQKLFQGYVGPQSVDADAVRDAGGPGGAGFLTVIHRTRNYRVLVIQP